MISNQVVPVVAERNRILAELRRREREVGDDRESPLNPFQLLARMGAYRTAVTMLHRAGVFPRTGDPCLEIGYGTRGWLGFLIDWGIREKDLHGIELDAVSARKAQEILPLADLRVGDATELPWKTDTFRLVIASTVFTSILDQTVRTLVAREITRVLAPGGALLWYDFKFNNPRNPAVRKVSRKDLTHLFPGLTGRITSLQLAPPLARLLAPRSLTLSTLLEIVPPLRTHLLAVLVKPVV